MKIMIAITLVIFLIGGVGLISIISERQLSTSSFDAVIQKNRTQSIWPYTCIDTMKTSRDTARRWRDREDLLNHIAKEISTIKDTGANCVAISTPYDDEFVPYLGKWVQESRRQGLHVWFRGNFSKWENWFEYDGDMTIDELFESSKSFISSNPNMFEDGDIFTIAPEGENGGPFRQVEVDEHEAYRAFLIEEYQVCKESFLSIGKDVKCNWLSMNGGLAKRSLDQATIDALSGTVTLDHYIKTAPEMGEFINYFYKMYGSRVIIGEFGAPVPEINGDMTTTEQASFVAELFSEMYLNRSKVDGVNYWVLYDSSTRLIEDDFTPREALSVVKQYYSPAVVRGKVVDDIGLSLQDVAIFDQKGNQLGATNEFGLYNFTIPAKSDIFTYKHDDYFPQSRIVQAESATEYSYLISMEPMIENFEYKFKKIFKLK